MSKPRNLRSHKLAHMLLAVPDLVVAVMDAQFMSGILTDDTGAYGPVIVKQESGELFLAINPNGEFFGTVGDGTEYFDLDMTPLPTA